MATRRGYETWLRDMVVETQVRSLRVAARTEGASRAQIKRPANPLHQGSSSRGGTPHDFQGDVTPKSTKNDLQKLLFSGVLCPQRTSKIDALVLGIILVEFGTLGTLWDPCFDHLFSGSFPENFNFFGNVPPPTCRDPSGTFPPPRAHA